MIKFVVKKNIYIYTRARRDRVRFDRNDDSISESNVATVVRSFAGVGRMDFKENKRGAFRSRCVRRFVPPVKRAAAAFVMYSLVLYHFMTVFIVLLLLFDDNIVWDAARDRP